MTDKRTIELLFSYKKYAVGSALIKLHQGAPFSHTAIKFWSKYMNMDLVYEANIHGVVVLPFETWEAKGNVITASACFDIDNQALRTKLQRAFAKLGKAYGKMTIMGLLFKGRSLGVDGDKSFICSELAADFLESELPKLDKPRDQITPNDLFCLVKDL